MSNESIRDFQKNKPPTSASRFEDLNRPPHTRKSPHGVVVPIGNSAQNLSKINNDLSSPSRKILLIDRDGAKQSNILDPKSFSRLYLDCSNNSPQLV